MKRIGWVLLLAGSAWLAFAAIGHGPIHKAVLIKHLQEAGAQATYTSQETRERMSALGLALWDHRPWALLPGAMMLAGGVILGLSKQRSSQHPAAPYSEPAARSPQG